MSVLNITEQISGYHSQIEVIIGLKYICRITLPPGLIKALWFVACVNVCACALKVPNQCLAGMLIEPQTDTGKHNTSVIFCFKLDLSANTSKDSMFCECGYLVI